VLERLKQAGARRPAQELDAMVPRVKQVMNDQSAHLSVRYARRRQAPQPVRAVDRNHRKGKAGKPNEFGRW